MPRPFIIVFVARSGSTALKFDLDQHPEIRMKAEVMGRAVLPRGLEPTDDNRLAWLRDWWGDGRKARGFKFQFNLGEPQFGDLPRLGEEIGRHGAAVIRLGRRDRLRQAVSALRAEALVELTARVTGEAIGHVRASDPEELRAFRDRPSAIDVGRLQVMLAGIEANVSRMDGFLAGFEGVVRVDYEDYLADRMAVLNAVAAAAGVAPFEAAPAEVLTKTTSDDLREAVANYDEVAAAAEALGLRP